MIQVAKRWDKSFNEHASHLTTYSGEVFNVTIDV